jgi:hypothetical protein
MTRLGFELRGDETCGDERDQPRYATGVERYPIRVGRRAAVAERYAR